MPFITKERRKLIDTNTIKADDLTNEDHAYIYLRDMVKLWRSDKGRNWETIHSIYEDVLRHSFTLADRAAMELAWQVFHNLYVYRYILNQMYKNGEL